MIKKGEIEHCSYKDNLGRWVIDKVQADQVLAMPSIQRQSAIAKRDRERGEAEQKKVEEAAKNPQTYTDARTGNEYIKLHMAKIALAEKQGSLIDKAKAVNDTYIMARGIREQLFNIPDRVAASFAAEKDERKIHLELSNEIRAALQAALKFIKEFEEKRK